MNSEEGFAWTLVMSFALKNKAMDQVRVKGLVANASLNQHLPNWNLYTVKKVRFFTE